jgi:outer membrane protein
MLKKLVLLLSLQAVVSSGTALAETEQNLWDIYQQAVANDPSLAAAGNQNKAAQELIAQAKALYRPDVNFNAGVSATHSDIKYNGNNSIFKTQGGNGYESYKYGVEARQAIYRKASLVGIEQSKVQVSLADKQLYLSRQDLILRTTKAYFDVLNTQDQIALIVAQKAAILSQLEQAKATFEVGTATITDVNEAQARYDLILSQEIAASNAYEIARRALQAIVAKAPEKLAVVKPNLQVQPMAQSMQDWEDLALNNNLNIQLQQDTLKLSEQNIESAKSGHYPTLDAVASYDSSYSNGSANGFGSDLKSAVIGLELNVPIYQGGGVNSKVRQASYSKDKALDDLEYAKRQADLETQRAYLNLNSSIAQVKALEQALKSSQSQLDSTKLGYEVGVRTSVDVLNAQQQFFSAKRDLLQARYNYLVSIIQLKTASGIVTDADVQDINQQLVLSTQ